MELIRQFDIRTNRRDLLVSILYTEDGDYLAEVSGQTGDDGQLTSFTRRVSQVDSSEPQSTVDDAIAELLLKSITSILGTDEEFLSVSGRLLQGNASRWKPETGVDATTPERGSSYPPE